MNVYLTFDVEVWCDGWSALDEQFPAAYDRYIFGRSSAGEYALPKTLEILNRHGLQGVFFVEPLFAERFGQRYLEKIVRLLQEARQDIQLHLHPEWVNELPTNVIADQSRKRQHLIHYSLEEQTALIAHALKQFAALGVSPTAFRAGSYAANADTLTALARNGIYIDSSLNRCYPLVSGAGLPKDRGLNSSFNQGGVTEFPVSIFQDGLGKLRPAHMTAVGLREFKQVLADAKSLDQQHFVIVSHNFEMLHSASTTRDRMMVRRFEGLCKYLAENRPSYTVCTFSHCDDPVGIEFDRLPRSGAMSTYVRFGEQIVRRAEAALV